MTTATETKTLTCADCGNTYTPDQLSLRLENEKTAFCDASGLFHNFDDTPATTQEQERLDKAVYGEPECDCAGSHHKLGCPATAEIDALREQMTTAPATQEQHTATPNSGDALLAAFGRFITEMEILATAVKPQYRDTVCQLERRSRCSRRGKP